MKGICKGLNKYISHIFVVKERQIEIGYPMDVKHVAHIGWEGGSTAPPCWMAEFKTGPEFSAPSASGISIPGALITSHGFDVSVPANGTCKWPQRDVEIMGRQVQQRTPQEDIPCVPNKHRQKKIKATTPKGSSSSTRSHREKKSKSRFANKVDKTPDLYSL